MSIFKLVNKNDPAGDQPKAIKEITESLKADNKYQTLLGVTGSGKTYTMANVIAKMQKPTIILSHNKTLAAQLFREFKEFFPYNAVEYFVSYYDYYQPEAYVPKKDLFIEKDSQVNEEIERLRISAMSSMLSRKDVIIIATVSSIYGAGNPDDFNDLTIHLKVGQKINTKAFLTQLVQIQYERNEYNVVPGTFRRKGDVFDIYLAGGKAQTRLELFGDEIESIKHIDPITGRKIEDLENTIIYPAKAYVTKPEKLKAAIKSIRVELKERIEYFKNKGMDLEAKRIEARTNYDLEMIEEMGFCKGIEHYSRHLDGKSPGSPPFTLLHYFPHDFLCFVDESHITLPQFGGMYNGDRSRKQNLVDYGYRLPCALDNRPLNSVEFDEVIPQFLFVSATPSKYELEKSTVIAEQLIRPTGLVDPTIEVKTTEYYFDDVMVEAQKRINNNERVIITTITKKLSENITLALSNNGFKVRYLHSEIETIERVEILHDLRAGIFDILVGINLLREGIDLPEVSLIAIFDADKIGFLRSTTSLIQIIGRAARNVNGHVIMYADKESDAMKQAIEITNQRRDKQLQYNEEHGITPTTIQKAIVNILERKYKAEIESTEKKDDVDIKSLRRFYNLKIKEDISAYKGMLKAEMLKAADNMEFKKATKLRDELFRIEKEG